MPERIVHDLGLLSLVLAALAGAIGGGGAVALYALHKYQQGAEDLPRWPYIVSAAIYGAVSGAPTAMVMLTIGRPLEEALGWAILAGTLAVAGALGVLGVALRVVRTVAKERGITATGIYEREKKSKRIGEGDD